MGDRGRRTTGIPWSISHISLKVDSFPVLMERRESINEEFFLASVPLNHPPPKFEVELL